jgi:hypothetical protein
MIIDLSVVHFRNVLDSSSRSTVISNKYLRYFEWEEPAKVNSIACDFELNYNTTFEPRCKKNTFNASHTQPTSPCAAAPDASREIIALYMKVPLSNATWSPVNGGTGCGLADAFFFFFW